MQYIYTATKVPIASNYLKKKKQKRKQTNIIDTLLANEMKLLDED